MRLLSCLALLCVSCASLPGTSPSADAAEAGEAPGLFASLFDGAKETPHPGDRSLRLDYSEHRPQVELAPDPEASADVAPELEAIMSRLSAARLAFIDPETLESFRAVGPYRIVSWDDSELKLVGHDADGLGAAHIDVRTGAGSMWVVAQIRDREFLLRVD